VEEIFGYKPNEVIGNNVNMLMPNPHAERHDSYIKNYIAGGEAKVIGKVRNVAAKHKNGTVFPVSLQVEQLKIGNINLFRGKIEKVETMEAVFTIDDTGTIVSCNMNYVEPLCGYSNHDLMGKNIGILFPPVHQPSGKRSMEEAITIQNDEDEQSPLKKQKLSLQEGIGLPESWQTPGVHRKLLRHKDGSLFPIDLEIGAFQDDNGTWLFSGRIKRSAEVSKNSDLESAKAIGNYIVVKTVGQGSYGKVKLAYHKDTKEQYAIKILQKSGMKPLELERARRETEILKQLIHPHIARLYEVIETPTTLNLIMEFAESTLLNYVLERNGLGESEAKVFFRQIIGAVKYCHDLNIIHRDIKHQNLLLDINHNVKLIDFGLTNFMEEGKLRSTFCGTPAYAAPEMILGKKYVGPEVDIWSLGVVLYSMITGVFPFENVADIIKGQYVDPPTAGKECCDLIRKMLDTNITQRITVDGIQKHPWVAEDGIQKQKPDVKEIEVKVVSATKVENGTNQQKQ
jgi:tRNA A-37 threonylcarbamoyl transferase component Bud32/PAS domain-containing protein